MEHTNITVANCTTAAQYFHLLRSQIRRNFRKPLIVAAPKKLLKFRGANSDMDDFAQGLRFKRVLGDVNPSLVPADRVRRVVMCSGQVYYDLEAARKAGGHNDVAIIRVEQMAPFPFRSVLEETNKYKNAELLWAQEEPKNAGGWQFMEPRIRNLIKHSKGKLGEVKYAGRPIMAATATGYSNQHKQELENLLATAFAK